MLQLSSSELTQLGRSEPLVFELGSHYQMMGTNPAQNFGVVLLNLYPVCLHQAALSWCFLARELKTLIHVSLSIYIHILVLENIVFLDIFYYSYKIRM